jgi:hypothetical protein
MSLRRSRVVVSVVVSASVGVVVIVVVGCGRCVLEMWL